MQETRDSQSVFQNMEFITWLEISVNGLQVYGKIERALRLLVLMVDYILRTNLRVHIRRQRTGHYTEIIP